MRDIKFRVWNPKHKEMRHWGFIEGDMFTGIPTGAGLTIEECSKSMQFTGLKDKSGKEIYEGDVLKCHSGYKWIVSWNEDHACFQVTCPPVVVEIIDNGNMEVIGNIHQNPGLL